MERDRKKAQSPYPRRKDFEQRGQGKERSTGPGRGKICWTRREGSAGRGEGEGGGGCEGGGKNFLEEKKSGCRPPG